MSNDNARLEMKLHEVQDDVDTALYKAKKIEQQLLEVEGQLNQVSNNVQQLQEKLKGDEL